jgi:hypothetical protein
MVGWIILGVYLLGLFVIFWVPAFTGHFIFDDDDPVDHPLEIFFPLFWPILGPTIGMWLLRDYIVERKKKFESDKREILR